MPDERPETFEWSVALAAGIVVAVGAILLRSATLLPPGFFDGVAAASIGFGAAPLAHRLLGAPAAPLARGAGLALAAVPTSAALVPPFDRAALPLACWMVGGALLAASVRARRQKPVPAAVGALLVLVGAAAAWAAAETWPESARLRWAIGAAGALAAVGLAARLVVARKAPRLAPSPVGVLLVAALLAAYLGYRPLVATRVANLPLYEWTIGVGIAALVLGRLRRSARDDAVPEAWTGEARRHTEDARAAYDPRMLPLAHVIDRYLETGEGFEEYRRALARGAPHAPDRFRKALQGAAPVQGRGRKQARKERGAAHAALMSLLSTEVPDHGDTPAPVRAHP